MPNVMISLKRTRSDQEQRCGVCGATFILLEGSGSRVFKVKTTDEHTLSGLLCGGCHSKWSGGTTVTLNATKEQGRPAAGTLSRVTAINTHRWRAVVRREGWVGR